MEFQAWSQEKRVYEGNHEMNEQVASITVEDLLWAMYTIGAKLTDENLEKSIELVRHAVSSIEDVLDTSGLLEQDEVK